MTLSSDISQKMKKVGDKYADKLLENDVRPKTASTYMSICSRAYSMALKNDNTANALVQFAARIKREQLRGDIYAAYLKFCIEREIESQGRNTFYNALRQLKFKDKKDRDGQLLLIPPKSLPKIEL